MSSATTLEEQLTAARAAVDAEWRVEQLPLRIENTARAADTVASERRIHRLDIALPYNNEQAANATWDLLDAYPNFYDEVFILVVRAVPGSKAHVQLAANVDAYKQRIGAFLSTHAVRTFTLIYGVYGDRGLETLPATFFDALASRNELERVQFISDVILSPDACAALARLVALPASRLKALHWNSAWVASPPPRANAPLSIRPTVTPEFLQLVGAISQSTTLRDFAFSYSLPIAVANDEASTDAYAVQVLTILSNLPSQLEKLFAECAMARSEAERFISAVADAIYKQRMTGLQTLEIIGDRVNAIVHASVFHALANALTTCDGSLRQLRLSHMNFSAARAAQVQYYLSLIIGAIGAMPRLVRLEFNGVFTMPNMYPALLRHLVQRMQRGQPTPPLQWVVLVYTVMAGPDDLSAPLPALPPPPVRPELEERFEGRFGQPVTDEDRAMYARNAERLRVYSAAVDAYEPVAQARASITQRRNVRYQYDAMMNALEELLSASTTLRGVVVDAPYLLVNEPERCHRIQQRQLSDPRGGAYGVSIREYEPPRNVRQRQANVVRFTRRPDPRHPMVQPPDHYFPDARLSPVAEFWTSVSYGILALEQPTTGESMQIDEN